MPKRVTAADVARAAGVSRATVGFVLNQTPGQTISETTRERVLGEAERLGYRPHSAARALASGRSRIVLVLLPDWPVEYSMRANLDEASLVLDHAGYSLVTTTPHPGGQAVPLWQTLAPEVVLSLAEMPDEQYRALRASGTATLIPGRDARELERELQFGDGPRVQITHLVDTGRRAIAFVGTGDTRLHGLNAQRRELAQATHLELTGRTLRAEVDVTEDTVAPLVLELIDRGVDGIAAYNDDVAALVLAAAVRDSIPVPERLAIIGHDDAPLARLLVPSLSSVRVDTAGLGRFLAELALHRVGAGAEPTLGAEAHAVLVQRETT